jgi:hypothetical protein
METKLDSAGRHEGAEAVARRILREKHNKHTAFYDSISYRGGNAI